MNAEDGTIARSPQLQADETLVRENFWRKLRHVSRRIPFAEDLIAAFYCAIDRETPAQVKAVLLGALAYFVIPTDLLPDFLAPLGFTDDATVLIAAVNAIGGHLKPRHREKARAVLAAELSKD